MFLAFSPEQLCSNLSRQMKSLLSLNWQVLKVLIMKFQASTSDHCHHLLIKLSCKSASEPLNAISARSAVCFLQPILQLSKKSLRPPLRLRFLYCIYTHRIYTNTERSIETEQRLALRDWLLPKYAFYKAFAYIRSGTRCHLILSD